MTQRVSALFLSIIIAFIGIVPDKGFTLSPFAQEAQSEVSIKENQENSPTQSESSETAIMESLNRDFLESEKVNTNQETIESQNISTGEQAAEALGTDVEVINSQSSIEPPTSNQPEGRSGTGNINSDPVFGSSGIENLADYLYSFEFIVDESASPHYNNTFVDFVLRIEIGNLDVPVLQSKLILEVEDTFVEVFQGSDIRIQSDKELISEDGKIKLIYHIPSLESGLNLEIPLRLKTKTFSTPHDYALELNASFQNQNGEAIASATPGALRFKNFIPEIVLTRLINASHYTQGGTNNFAGLPLAGDENLIDPGNMVPQTFAVLARGGNLPNNEGIRSFLGMEVEVTIPSQATFLEAENPGWVYNSMEHKAYLDWTNPVVLAYSFRSLPLTFKINFPNGDIRLDYINSVKITFLPKGETASEALYYVSNDDISYKISNVAPEYEAYKIASSSLFNHFDSRSQPINWDVVFTNKSEIYNMEDIILEDFNLDNRLKYTALRASTSFNSFEGLFDILFYDSMSQLISSPSHYNVSFTTNPQISIPDGTAKFTIKSTTGSYLKPNGTITLQVETNFKDPTLTLDESTPLYSYGLANAKYVNVSQIVQKQLTYNVPIQPYQPRIYLDKRITPSTVFTNEILDFSLGLISEKPVFGSDLVHANVLLELLPEGVEYITGSSSFNSIFSYTEIPLENLEPTILENYKNSSQTALVWRFSQPLKISNQNFHFKFIEIKFKTKATVQTFSGNNQSVTFLAWNNQDVFLPFNLSGTSEDQWDIDGDGDVQETVLKKTNTFNFRPPNELVLYQESQGSEDHKFRTDTSTTEYGQAIAYHLVLNNNSTMALNQFTSVMSIAQIGDTFFGGSRRDSEINLHLKAPAVEASNKFSAFYNLTESGSMTALEYANHTGWTSQVSDFKLVKGVKFVLNTGETISTNERIKIKLSFEISPGQVRQNGLIARQTFAYSINGINFFESPVHTFETVFYQVSGEVFQDGNGDGIYQNTESLIPGKAVALKKRNDHSGQLEHVTNMLTDANGFYQFDIEVGGDYQVVFEPNRFDSFSPLQESSNIAGSHVNNQGISDIFRLSISGASTPISVTNKTINAGIVFDKGILQIKTQIKNSTGSPISAPILLTYKIYLSGSLYNGMVQVNGANVSVRQGILVVSSDKNVYLPAQSINSPYKVEILNDGAYQVIPREELRTGTIQYGENLLNFILQEKDLGQISIRKIYKDTSGQIIEHQQPYTVKIQGPSFPQGETRAVSESMLLSNLVLGKYKVQEIFKDGTLGSVKEILLTISSSSGEIVLEETIDVNKPTTPIPTPVPVFSKLPSKTDVILGEEVEYAMANFDNKSNTTLVHYKVVDLPPEGLDFVSANIPVLHSANPIAYQMFYNTNLASNIALRTDLQTNSAYSILAPNLQPGEYITQILFLFPEVGAGFGKDNSIVLKFKVTERVTSSTIINKAYLSYSNKSGTVKITNSQEKSKINASKPVVNGAIRNTNNTNKNNSNGNKNSFNSSDTATHLKNVLGQGNTSSLLDLSKTGESWSHIAVSGVGTAFLSLALWLDFLKKKKKLKQKAK